MKKELSKIYVDKKGLLRCGDQDKDSSRVEGVTVEYKNIEDPATFSFRLVFTTSHGFRCHGYRFSCSSEHWIDIEKCWE